MTKQKSIAIKMNIMVGAKEWTMTIPLSSLKIFNTNIMI